MEIEKLSKGEKTKRHIMDVATNLFLKVGLYDITFQMIADEVGITMAGVYKYFPSMDELLLESCSYWVNSSVSYINEDAEFLLTAREYLDQYFERHFIYTEKNRAQDALLFGVYYSAMRSPKMLALYSQIKERAIKKIDLILQKGCIDGSWKIDETTVLAQTLHSFLVGEIIKILIEPKKEKPRAVFKRVQKHYLRLLGLK